MCLELGVLQVKFVIMEKRLNFLKYILDENITSIIRQVYEALKEDSRKGDFVSLIKTDMEELKIAITEEEIVRPSKSDIFCAVRIYLQKICAKLCTESVKKHIRFDKNFVKLCQKYEKVTVLQVQRSKVKILRRFQKILRRHASPCPCVLEALEIVSLKKNDWKKYVHEIIKETAFVTNVNENKEKSKTKHIYFEKLVGMQECMNVGMQDCSNVGMQECRNGGMLECRNVGMQERRNLGMQVCRYVGVQVCRYVGM